MTLVTVIFKTLTFHLFQVLCFISTLQHPADHSILYYAPHPQVWDLGGQTSIRPYWRCYYPNTDAIIFVVDSVDSERLGIAKQELMAMLEVRSNFEEDVILKCFVHQTNLMMR